MGGERAERGATKTKPGEIGEMIFILPACLLQVS